MPKIFFPNFAQDLHTRYLHNPYILGSFENVQTLSTLKEKGSNRYIIKQAIALLSKLGSYQKKKKGTKRKTSKRRKKSETKETKKSTFPCGFENIAK